MNFPLRHIDAAPDMRAPAPEHRYDDSAVGDGRVGLTVIALFFGVFGVWAAFAPLDAAVVAAGEVKVSGNHQIIQHQEGGIISRVAVREGEHVAAGQVLVELSAVELMAQEQALGSQTIELQASRERLVAESARRNTITRPRAWDSLPEDYKDFAQEVLDRQQRELNTSLGATGTRVSVLSQRQRETEARIAGYHQQIAALDRQSELLSAELEGLRNLASEGFAAETRVRAAERQASEIEGRRAELAALIEQSRESIGETRLQSISTRQDRATQIAEELRLTDTRLADVAPRWQATRQQLEATRIRANVAGEVVGLAFFNAGAVVRPGERILDLVPDEHGLIMQVRVRPMDADNLAIGQNAMVRFSAFEGRRIPHVRGRVETLSADRFEDSRTGQPYFLADVRVDAEELAVVTRAMGVSTLPLSPGLPVEVVIPLRKRTALEYVLEPLQQTLWRSFREH